MCDETKGKWYTLRTMPELPGLVSPEAPKPTPEAGPGFPESTPERPTPALERRSDVQPVDIFAGVLPTPPPPTETVTGPITRRQVEDVLSDGLDEMYKQLDPATQQRVKVAGEQTARQISSLLQEAKVQVKKIVDLIVSWLRLIPGINQHFVEQEAKIKADKLLAMKPPSV